MKYKLPRPVYNEEVIALLHREMKKQKYAPPKVSLKALKQLVGILEIIKKQGLPDHLVLKKLPEPMGWGIFLHPKAKAIPRGDAIAIYSGDVVISPQNIADESAYAFAPIEDMTLTKLEQPLFDKKHTHHARRLYSFNIDAAKDGNFTRFINHSEKPNVEARLLEIPVNKLGLHPAPIEVVYFAKKNILPSQQLLVSYEDGEACYWSVLGIKPEPILPGSFTIDESLKLIDHRT
jgi:hypothetical protein